MILLAIDTAAALCAACVFDSGAGSERGRVVFDIGKGHAEHLMPAIAGALAEAGLSYGDLDRIAVSVGPGSFTGVRVGVAAARGLALALKIPALGIDTLEAVAAETRAAFPGRAVVSALDGRRGDLYCAACAEDGSLLSPPAAMPVADGLALIRAHDAVAAGSGVEALLNAAGSTAFTDGGSRQSTADIAVYARLAAGRDVPPERPKPLYLRGSGARPQAGFALARKAP